MEYTHPKKSSNFHGDKIDESQLFIGHTITIFWRNPQEQRNRLIGAMVDHFAVQSPWQMRTVTVRLVRCTMLAMFYWVVDHFGWSNMGYEAYQMVRFMGKSMIETMIETISIFGQTQYDWKLGAKMRDGSILNQHEVCSNFDPGPTKLRTEPTEETRCEQHEHCKSKSKPPVIWILISGEPKIGRDPIPNHVSGRVFLLSLSR